MWIALFLGIWFISQFLLLYLIVTQLQSPDEPCAPTIPPPPCGYGYGGYGYGYGYGSAGTSLRKGSETRPNFYKRPDGRT